jgi:hypothetical protein
MTGADSSQRLRSSTVNRLGLATALGGRPVIPAWRTGQAVRPPASPERGANHQVAPQIAAAVDLDGAGQGMAIRDWPYCWSPSSKHSSLSLFLKKRASAFEPMAASVRPPKRGTDGRHLPRSIVGEIPMSMQMTESRNVNVIAFIIEKAAIAVLLGAACASLFAIMTGLSTDLPMLLT